MTSEGRGIPPFGTIPFQFSLANPHSFQFSVHLVLTCVTCRKQLCADSAQNVYRAIGNPPALDDDRWTRTPEC